MDIADLREVVHGTTLVTNAVIERKGARTGMLITEGFRDIPDMREEKRYDVFDLRITFPDPIVPRARRREVSERMRFDGTVERPLDLEAARAAVLELVREEGIEALAILPAARLRQSGPRGGASANGRRVLPRSLRVHLR